MASPVLIFLLIAVGVVALFSMAASTKILNVLVSALLAYIFAFHIVPEKYIVYILWIVGILVLIYMIRDTQSGKDAKEIGGRLWGGIPSIVKILLVVGGILLVIYFVGKSLGGGGILETAKTGIQIAQNPELKTALETLQKIKDAMAQGGEEIALQRWADAVKDKTKPVSDRKDAYCSLLSYYRANSGKIPDRYYVDKGFMDVLDGYESEFYKSCSTK